ncbi:MAG TPA: hypothetical protein DEB40_01375 [Elusimicrobia bacterium]|nr:hypothetical protein [Elusimicrobiota bacterium]HBT60381.1 hypothetical protein [Elusimicrobiota bacterium]
MAKKPQMQPPTPPSIPPAQAVPLLEEQRERLRQISNKRPFDEREHGAWENFIHALLIKSFGSESKNIHDVIYADGGPLRMGMSDREIEQNHINKTANQIAILGSCIEQLKMETRLQQAANKPLDADRGSLLEDIFVKFANEADLVVADQFEIDHQDKIEALDSLLRDGTLTHTDGKIEFSLRSYVDSKFWAKDEALINQLLPIMKEMYSEKKTGLHEVADFIARIERTGLIVKPINIQRVLQIIRRVGLLNGYNQIVENGIQRIKSFGVSPMILRPKTIAEQLAHYLVARTTISSARTFSAGGTAAPTTKDNRKVFIVHGHNDKLRGDVARLIMTLGLEPIILHEKANQGQTLMEKFLKHSDVGFAMIVMTADDTGKAKTEDTPRPRARQNVVFEWGFFVGKLGRDRVCALYEQGIELPSDLQGIVYIPLDVGGHWRFGLIKELKAAGYAVDANKLLE